MRHRDQPSFEVPPNLNPEYARDSLPSPTPDDLLSLQRAGFASLGIAAAIMNLSGGVLMFEHKSPDGSEGLWEPLAETSKMAGNGVESTAATLYRGVIERTGVVLPELPLLARTIGSWALSKWPISMEGQENTFACAICPVTEILDYTVQQRLLSGFRPNDKINRIEFVPLDEVNNRPTRPGTTDWHDAIKSSNLIPVYGAQRDSTILWLHAPAQQPGLDIDLTKFC